MTILQIIFPDIVDQAREREVRRCLSRSLDGIPSVLARIPARGARDARVNLIVADSSVAEILLRRLRASGFLFVCRTPEIRHANVAIDRPVFILGAPRAERRCSLKL